MIIQAPNLAKVDVSPAPPSQASAGDRVAAASPEIQASIRTTVPEQSPESLQRAVAAMNRAAKSLNASVEMSLDADSGKPVVRVIDTETGQLIRQIPSEEILDLQRALDRLAGMLIHRTA